MLDSIGKRLAFLRNLLKLSRREVIEENKGWIRELTLLRWENNQNKIPDKKLDILLAYFSSKGLNTTPKWVKTGFGIPPLLSNLENLKRGNLDDFANSLFSELELSISGFHYFQLTNDWSTPILKQGDYVGGFIEELSQELDGELCFFSNSQQEHVGILSFKTKKIKNWQGDSIIINQEDKSIKIGKARWIMKG